MDHKEPAFGFWIPVTDKSSAEYAAKMSGFPVFLLGLSFVMLGISQFIFMRTLPLNIIGLILFISGFFLVFSGLQIRKLKFQTLPFSVSIWFFLNGIVVYFSGIGLGTILTALIALMAACGLRGWYWLRSNKTA